MVIKKTNMDCIILVETRKSMHKTIIVSKKQFLTLMLLYEALSHQEIAKKLKIPFRTVGTYSAQLIKMLGIKRATAIPYMILKKQVTIIIKLKKHETISYRPWE